MLGRNIITRDIRLMLFLILCIVVGCDNKADSYNKKGISLYNRGKYTEAIEEFKKALELNPKHYDAHFHLGIVYYAKGMIDESITELKKAIDAAPDEPKAHYNIAFAYVAKENIEEALSEYQKAINLFAADRKSVV